jgi:hypothetical protein
MAKSFSTKALSFGIEEMVTGREIVDSEEHEEPFCFTEKMTDLPINGVKFSIVVNDCLPESIGTPSAYHT